MKPRKTLEDLTLLDRFLFAEAMEDAETLQSVLEIILGREVVLKFLPQTEKEVRRSPIYRHIKLDVWSQDMQNVIYDTEVQKTDTKNLPRRSRYYQSIIDGKLLEPGEVDFNTLNDVYIIIIAPFDLFGFGRYQYTFRMNCEEEPCLCLGDGAVRIFLNTRGIHAEHISPELIELLHYMEHTTWEPGKDCKSERIKKLQRRIESIKSDEEVSVRYMQEWEERELARREAIAEGIAEGREEGRKVGREEGREVGREEGREVGREEGREEGLEEGRKAGREAGIQVLVETCVEFGVSKEDTLTRVEEKFSLSKEEARSYLEKYWG